MPANDKAMSPHLLEILLRLMFIGVAAILLGFAAWMTVSNIRIINTHSKALAEVVSSERVGPAAAKGLNNYIVQLRFDVNGSSRTVELDRSNTNYEVGQVIPIYYEEETGYKAIPGDFWGMWLFVIVVAIPGLVLLFFGVKPRTKVR